MYKKLQELAHLYSGHVFRGAIKNNQRGSVYVIQGKDISVKSDILDLSQLVLVTTEKIRSPRFLQYGDVLVVSRGLGIGSFRTSVFVSRESNVMVSSSVNVVRLTDVTVLPKYLSVYLNSAPGQQAISKIVSGGSYIQTILLKNLATLEIPVPPVHIQKIIISLCENIAEQEKIFKRKLEIYQTIIDSSINNLIK